MAKLWGVIPAAGVGSRMKRDRPKQYLPLAGLPVIEHSLSKLRPVVEAVMIAGDVSNPWWMPPDASDVHYCPGGKERVDSVLNALGALLAIGARRDDWVLVHDAARPLVPNADIQRLVGQIDSGEAQALLLAAPVSDTIKRSDDGVVVSQTVERDGLWRALTPQASPIGQLIDAIHKAQGDGVSITDECSALEYWGISPTLVPSDPINFKITHPADLLVAEALLSAE